MRDGQDQLNISEERNKMIVALLLGRGGSKGVKNKNIREILGRPMMEYSILAAKNSGLIDELFISTDSPKIAEIAQRHDLKLIKRPPHLASDESLLEDALAHGYHYIKNELGIKIDMLVILLCNAATVTTRAINKGIEILNNDTKKEIDSCVSVVQKNEFIPLRAKKIENGVLVPAVDISQYPDANCDRNSTGKIYYCTVDLFICRPRAIENIKDGILPFKWIGKKTVPIVVDGGLDVDNEEGFAVTEYWLKQHGFTETETPYDKK